MIYTLRQGSKTVSLKHNDCHYVIGYKNVIVARKVHYFMHPDCDFNLMRDKNPVRNPLTLDIRATLSIPKCEGSIMDPMNDGAFHIHVVRDDVFLSYPMTGLGIIMPYDLQDENDKEFVFTSYVIDPTKFDTMQFSL